VGQKAFGHLVDEHEVAAIVKGKTHDWIGQEERQTGQEKKTDENRPRSSQACLPTPESYDLPAP
jgi:hypothetical protein